MLKGLKIKLPSKEELEELNKQSYIRTKENKNNMSYWLPYVSNLGFNIPKTVIIPFDYDTFSLIRGDNFTSETVQILQNYIYSKLCATDLVNHSKLFIKSGVFSNKFNFKTCKLDDVSNLAAQFLDLYYTSGLLGACNSSELVIREYIEGLYNYGYIYNGMPLNVEYRLFYNFDTCELLGVYNYWDTTVMLDNLRGDDLEVFKKCFSSIEHDYELNKNKLLDNVLEKLSQIYLKGIWSIDFMYVNDKFYLIDMALGEESYYYDRLLK